MSSSLNVVMVGFSRPESVKIEKILSLTQSRERQYIAQEEKTARNFNIVLANADDALALAKAEELASRESIIALVGSNPETARGRCFIPKPIISYRFLSALDALSAAHNAAIETGKPATASVAANGDVDYRILVVDDSKTVHKAMEFELQQIPKRLDIDYANSGEEALDHIGRHKVYDIIFLDVMMPGIDGNETCKEIRKDARYKSKTPIIMLSAKTSPLDEVKSVISGSTTYLTKPIVHTEFQKMLKRVVSCLDRRQ